MKLGVIPAFGNRLIETNNPEDNVLIPEFSFPPAKIIPSNNNGPLITVMG